MHQPDKHTLQVCQRDGGETGRRFVSSGKRFGELQGEGIKYL